MDSETIAAEQLQEKWNPILEHGDMPQIEDSYRKRVTAILLENQENHGNYQRCRRWYVSRCWY